MKSQDMLKLIEETSNLSPEVAKEVLKDVVAALRRKHLSITLHGDGYLETSEYFFNQLLRAVRVNQGLAVEPERKR